MWPIVRRSSQKTRIGLLVELRKVVDQASIGKAASKQVLTISNLAPPSVQARNGEFKTEVEYFYIEFCCLEGRIGCL